MQIADSIKVLDMSLPAYDEIKTFKASVENVKSLSVTPAKGESIGIPTSQKKKGTPMSSVLPSVDKKGPKQKTSPEGYSF